MSAPSKKLVDRIVEDRISFLFELLKKKPLHHIPKTFKEKYNIELWMDELEKVYPYWRPWSNKAFWATMSDLKGSVCKDEFLKIIERIEEQTEKDVVDFIYKHWKQYEKQKQDQK